MDVFPKFIIETDDELGDCLIIAKCTYHKQLATDLTKVKGGGWWVLKDNTFILSGKSEDFGKASIEDIKTCVQNGNVYTNSACMHPIAHKHEFAYDLGYELINLKTNI